jgi:hypothetical protein
VPRHDLLSSIAGEKAANQLTQSGMTVKRNGRQGKIAQWWKAEDS